ncbi:MAG: T9SS type A sorting domain-containing protein, partial [Bacteroidota bacterium]
GWFAADSATLVYPEVGTNLTYDFRYVGDLISEELDGEVALRDIPRDSLIQFRAFLPDRTLDSVVAGLPEEAIGLAFFFPFVVEDSLEFDFTGAVFAETRDDGLYTLVESTLEIDLVDGEITTTYEALDQPELAVPFGLSFGDSLTVSYSRFEEAFFGDVQDSIRETTTWKYVGTGTVQTWYDTYENIAVLESRVVTETWTDDRSGGYQLLVTTESETLDFYAEDTFLPVASFDREEDAFDPTAPPVVSAFFSQQIASGGQTSTRRSSVNAFPLSLAPNPAATEISLRFTPELAGPTQLHLYNAVGQRVFRQDMGHLAAGEQSFTLALPESLADGAYFLQLTVGGERTVARRLLLRR